MKERKQAEWQTRQNKFLKL